MNDTQSKPANLLIRFADRETRRDIHAAARLAGKSTTQEWAEEVLTSSAQKVLQQFKTAA